MRVQTGEAARLLGISRRTVQSLAARGLLPGAAQVGKLYTFDAAKLRAYLAGWTL